jgi:hypothetical protein
MTNEVHWEALVLSQHLSRPERAKRGLLRLFGLAVTDFFLAFIKVSQP